MSATMRPSTLVNDSQQISPHEIISQVIEERYSSLRYSVQVMVARSGLVEGEDKIVDIGDEILHNTIETALLSAGKFDPNRSAYSWLMGIAVNKLREMRRGVKYETKRVQVFEDKETDNNDSIRHHDSDDNEDSTAAERIDAVLYCTSNRSLLEDHEQALKEMLALVKENERQILTLAIVDGLSGTDLAAVLGIREGAAYVRLARAKEHLRQKYLAIHGKDF